MQQQWASPPVHLHPDIITEGANITKDHLLTLRTNIPMFNMSKFRQVWKIAFYRYESPNVERPEGHRPCYLRAPTPETVGSSGWGFGINKNRGQGMSGLRRFIHCRPLKSAPGLFRSRQNSG